jgi:hypothetical protein
MENQIKEIASIIHKHNKRANITINGNRASHLPISYESCLSYAKNIQLAFKFYKDGSKFGLMDVDKTLTDLRKIKGQIQKSIDLINDLPLTVKLPSNHFDMMKKLGLDSENSKPVLEYFKEKLVNFDKVYNLVVEYIKEENFKKSKINKEVLAVIKESVVIWRTVLNRKRPKYINRGNANDDFTNYLSEILKVFNLEPDIDNAYRNYIKWKEGKL